ncbi:hypothetical protein HMPREF9420_2039 [Segatella salivae DSM 15606]|uniref:Uncharacterized protein n=1 Tax=Segatella salivae DSM 15606 TaxID=888832 RepID=E6MRC1_9BACT|nr:hypothetical protein HMPREF9420_2039 [Segatella salivae DSM 15606]
MTTPNTKHKTTKPMKSKYHYPTRNRYKKAFNDVFSYNVQCKQTRRNQ